MTTSCIKYLAYLRSNWFLNFCHRHHRWFWRIWWLFYRTDFPCFRLKFTFLALLLLRPYLSIQKLLGVMPKHSILRSGLLRKAALRPSLCLRESDVKLPDFKAAAPFLSFLQSWRKRDMGYRHGVVSPTTTIVTRIRHEKFFGVAKFFCLK